jgi:hypothetical protein
MRVTHYQADWINNSSAWPAPTWPLQIGPPATLFGDLKDSLQRPLVLRGVFPAGPASIRIDQVSAHATLVITADSQTVLQHQFVPGPGKGEWQKSTYRPKWKDYEATYDRDFTFELQRDATELTLRVTRGDWLTFTSLSVGSVRIVPDEQPFGTRQGAFTVSADGTTTAQSGATRDDRTTLSNQAQRWQSFGQQQASMSANSASSTAPRTTSAWRSCGTLWSPGTPLTWGGHSGTSVDLLASWTATDPMCVTRTTKAT